MKAPETPPPITKAGDSTVGVCVVCDETVESLTASNPKIQEG